MVKLGRKRGIQTKRLIAIKNYLKRGYSTTKIQKRLSKRKLGVRRKVLLQEVRLIRGIKISEEKRLRAIPKKYRKPEVKIIKKWVDRVKVDVIFRVSYILQDIPIHSKPFKRNYLGFRLQAFSLDKEFLKQQHNILKDILIRETNKYLGFKCMENFNWNHVILNIESPTAISIHDALRFHNTWIFRVEKEGRELYSRSGRL